MKKLYIFTRIVFIAFLLLLPVSKSFSQSNLVSDGGFEAGPFTGNWVETSTNAVTPLCDLGTCGDGGGTGPYAGYYWTYFGGFSQFEEGEIQQYVTIPLGSQATLMFYLEIPLCDSPQDFLEVKIDSTTVYYIDGSSPLCGIIGYGLQVVDLSAFADGNSHSLSFHSISYSNNGGMTNIMVDNVSLIQGGSSNYNFIKGKLFVDLNNNLLQDIGEAGIPNVKIEASGATNSVYSNVNGDYTIGVLDTGIITITPDPVNLFTTAPLSIPVILNSFGNLDSNNNFAYQPITSFNDLSITLSPAGLFRSGFNGNYLIQYENVGTTVLNPIITFYPDQDIDYVSSSSATSLVTPDSIQWWLAPLSPFQSGVINVQVYIHQGLPIGTLINSSAKIDPVQNDTTSINNIHYWEILTTGSFDPNDILVNRQSLLTTEFPVPPYLYYTIRFQNTGNDTAFTVRVTNVLPPTLDHGTIELLGYSHDVNVTYNSQTHLMEYLFSNILLPDSNVNEPGSNGYISYRIKPINSLVAGDTIYNNADIYFDFNAPVHTNDAVTAIVLPTGMNDPDFLRNKIKFYPNPAMTYITVDLSKLKGNDIELEISDLLGRATMPLFNGTVMDDNRILQFDVSGLSKGIYFIHANSGDHSRNLKFIRY